MPNQNLFFPFTASNHQPLYHHFPLMNEPPSEATTLERWVVVVGSRGGGIGWWRRLAALGGGTGWWHRWCHWVVSPGGITGWWHRVAAPGAVAALCGSSTERGRLRQGSESLAPEGAAASPRLDHCLRPRPARAGEPDCSTSPDPHASSDL